MRLVVHWIVSLTFFRADELWEQLQKKSELYRSHVVLLPHGDDFRYYEEKEWDDQFTNLQKLMNFINNNKKMNMKVKHYKREGFWNVC